MNSINLLPSHKKIHLQGEKNLTLLRRVAIFSLGAIVFISLILFALNFDTASSAIQKQKNATETQLNLLNVRTAKLLHIKDRLASISKILKGRSSYDVLLSQVQLMVPQDVTVDDIEVQKGSLTMTLSSTSLLSLSNFLDSIADTTTNRQLFSSVAINSIMADSTIGKYSVVVKAKVL